MELASVRTIDESFLLSQTLSGGHVQSTFNDPAPQRFGHREKVKQFYFSLNVLWATVTTGRGWSKGWRQVLIASRVSRRNRYWDWYSGEGTAEVHCSLVLCTALELARRAVELLDLYLCGRLASGCPAKQHGYVPFHVLRLQKKSLLTSQVLVESPG